MTRSKQQIRTRLLKGHDKDCEAVKDVRAGVFKSPWQFFDTKTDRYLGGKDGRRGGPRWWLIARCGLPCAAALAINEDDLLGAAEACRSAKAA